MESKNSILEARQRQFMQSIDLEEQRSRREQFGIELRKENRDALTKKRRHITGNSTISAVSEEAETVQITELLSKKVLEAIPELGKEGMTEIEKLEVIRKVLVEENNPDRSYFALNLVRVLLSSGKRPPIETVANLDFLPVIFAYISPSHPKDILVESSWILCNMTSGSHEVTEAIVNFGGIEAFLGIIKLKNPDLSEHSVWGLGNIAADSPTYRDKILEAGGHKEVVELILHSQMMSQDKVAVLAWTLDMLVSFRPVVSIQVCESIIPAVRFLLTATDFTVLGTALSVLSHITSEDLISRLVVNSGLVPRVSDLLSTDNTGVIIPALRTIGNIASGDMVMTEHLLDVGILSKLSPLLHNPNVQIRKEVFWTLANITAGTSSQIQRFLEHSICPLAMIGLVDPELKVVKEASFVFTNIAKQGDRDQRGKLVDMNIFPYLKRAFPPDPEILQNVLDLSLFLLILGESENQLKSANPISIKFDQSGCLEELEQLQYNLNPVIAEKALMVFDRFFGLEDPMGDMEILEAPDEFQFS